MYSNIIDFKSGKKISIYSNTGKKIINTYKKLIGGANKLDWVKNMTKDEKTKPFYIENGKCVRYPYENIPILKSGYKLPNLTNLEKITQFYNYVFNIREGVVDNKGKGKKGFIYSNKIYCELFKNNNITTPLEFKLRVDDTKKILSDYFQRINQLNKNLNNIFTKIEQVKTQTDNFFFTNVEDKSVQKVFRFYSDTEQLNKFFNDLGQQIMEEQELLFDFTNDLHQYLSNIGILDIIIQPSYYLNQNKLNLIDSFHRINHSMFEFNIEENDIDKIIETIEKYWFAGPSPSVRLVDTIINKLESIKNKELDLNDIKLMLGYEPTEYDIDYDELEEGEIVR